MRVPLRGCRKAKSRACSSRRGERETRSGGAYSASPRIGCPKACMCTRSWWLRPVRGCSSNRLAGDGPSVCATQRQRVWLGWPRGSTRRRGTGFPVRPDGQVDQLPLQIHGYQTVNHSHVGLFDLPGFKQCAQRPLHLRATGHQHQTARRHVQTVDHQGIRVQRLYPRAQAVLLIGATARHGQEAGRFVQDQQAVVGKDDVHTAHRRGRFQGLPR